MAPITEYMDYRKYIRDFYAERKALSGFSWGAFAKLAGFSSQVFLQYVCEGKKNLSETSALQVANAMNLSNVESEFFKRLVSFGSVNDIDSKKKTLEAFLRFSEESHVKNAIADEYGLFKSWKNLLVRELAQAMPNASAKRISLASRRRISTGEVKKILDFLERAGYLEKENGNFRQTERSLKMGKAMSPVKRMIAHDLQIQMAELAVDALKNESAEGRDITGLTIGITRENYGRIVRELAECRRRIVAIATEAERTDEVYRLNMQFFPLTNIGAKRGSD